MCQKESKLFENDPKQSNDRFIIDRCQIALKVWKSVKNGWKILSALRIEFDMNPWKFGPWTYVHFSDEMTPKSWWTSFGVGVVWNIQPHAQSLVSCQLLSPIWHAFPVQNNLFPNISPFKKSEKETPFPIQKLTFFSNLHNLLYMEI